MNNFFGNQLPPEELQRQFAAQQQMDDANRQQSMGGGVPSAISQTNQHGEPMSAMSDTAMMGGDSLDDIIRNNSHEMNRRRSLPQQPYPGTVSSSDADRRVSMMEFGGSNDAFRGFQFGNPAMGNHFSNMAMPTVSTNYSQPGMLAMSDMNDYSAISPDMMGDMMAFSNLNVGQMGSNPGSIGLYSTNPLPDQYQQSPLESATNEFSMAVNGDAGSLSATPSNTGMGLEDGEEAIMNMPQPFAQSKPTLPQQQPMPNFSTSVTPSVSREVSYPSPMSSRAQSTPQTSQATNPVSTPAATPAPQPKEKSIYSKSGFDMLRALWYVATRKDAEIQLGAVDMSCAFVVCDVSLNDCPIIYVSDNFQNLTGYSQHEIMGQNCRFLQAPDGNVEAGTKREFVDNGAVLNLKRKIAEGKEVQQSLINYRKGGKPFLNLLTMIPIPWDTDEIRYFVGFQIDLVECPDAISGQEIGGVKVNYKHSDIGQYIWTPPNAAQAESDNGQTLGVDDVSTLLQQFNPQGVVSDWHKQSWDKMLLENTDDVVHVLSLKGLFLYLSPSCKRVLEYDTADLVGNSLSSICHPSDIVPVTRELKDTTVGGPVNIVFRIRRKESGYTWFESHGSLFVEQGKGRKCIILVGRKRPVFALSRRNLEANGGIGDSELWTKLSTSGMFLFISSNIRSLLDLQPDALVGTSIQDLMRKESRPEFGRSIEKARRGKIVTCKHEVQNRRGQVLQAQTILYPGDATEGQKPTFLLAQTKLLKASSRAIAPATQAKTGTSTGPALVDNSKAASGTSQSGHVAEGPESGGVISAAAGGALSLGSQDQALASDDNIFDELKTTRCTSWQYELRQMEKMNRILAEELGGLLSNKKKRKRRKGVGNVVRDCANCHTRNTPEWRRGPSGQRDLCNSCGLRWAKQTGRVSPRNSSKGGGNNDGQSKRSTSPVQSSPLQREVTEETTHAEGDLSGSPGDATTPTAASKNQALSMPPPSQPLLLGGSGAGGSGMEMVSIREERESSA